MNRRIGFDEQFFAVHGRMPGGTRALLQKGSALGGIQRSTPAHWLVWKTEWKRPTDVACVARERICAVWSGDGSKRS